LTAFSRSFVNANTPFTIFRGYSSIEALHGLGAPTCHSNLDSRVHSRGQPIPITPGLCVRRCRIESRNHRAILAAPTPIFHDGTVAGVFRELGNAFLGSSRQPTVSEMSQIYRLLRVQFHKILKKAGARDAFNARVFITRNSAWWRAPPQMNWQRRCRPDGRKVPHRAFNPIRNDRLL